MRVARRLLIGGRVQGVGFRWFAKDAAAREGVCGYVRNLPDGRVEAFVEGDAEAVTRVEAVPALGDLITRPHERGLEERTHLRIVIHHQNFGRFHPLRKLKRGDNIGRAIEA